MTSTFALIPGAASGPAYFQPLVGELRERGHAAIAVELPCDDESAGLADYADAVVAAVGERRDVVVVAHSFGGFTAPLVCERMPVSMIVLVQGMVPAPGESPSEWWEASGFNAAQREASASADAGDEDDEEMELWVHDVAPDLAAEAMRDERAQSDTAFESPWPLAAWPRVATRYVVCTQDRAFPPEFMRGLARDRLGVEPDEIATGHMPMLARPGELADLLVSYVEPA